MHACNQDSMTACKYGAMAEEPDAPATPKEEPNKAPVAVPTEGGQESPAQTQAETPKSSTAVKERPSGPKVDQLPPFRVLLHNDDVNEMGYVVRTLIELTPLDKTRSIEVTLEADATGVALLLVTHKERAELYQQQLKSKGLTATIEPAT